MGSLLALTLVGGSTVLTGCSADANSIAEQAKSGDQKGYVSGDGSVEKIALADRGAPVKLSGETIDGGSWAMPTTKDTVVVVNVWASWCPPCVAETPLLQKVWSTYEAKGATDPAAKVAFVGIDFRDNPEGALAFTKKSGVTYPSLSDESGVQILNLQGKAPGVPTTLVLDRSGRIAARINGAVTESTLTGLLDDALAEPGSS